MGRSTLSVEAVFVFALIYGGVQLSAAKSCRVPNSFEATGSCVPVEQCPHIFNQLVSLQVDPESAYKTYLQERICDRKPDGSIHICCDEGRTGKRRNMNQKNQKHNQCTTFRFTSGSCVPIESCPSIYNCSLELQRKYNPTLHLHLTQSYCYQDNGKSYVCCDDDHETKLKARKKLGWQRCQTPFQDTGKCVPPGRCGWIDDAENVPDVFRAFMVGCDQPNGVRHMCCPKSEVMYDEEPGKECTTRGGRSGRCVESDRCEGFLKATDRQSFVRDSWCYTSLDQVDYVCCANAKILNVPTKAIELGNRAGEDAPTCTTPNNAPGRCVSLAQCAPIANILRQASAAKTAVTPAQAVFLRNSVCTPSGTTSTTYFVCCDEVTLQTVTTPAPTITTTLSPAAARAAEIVNHPNLRLLDQTTCGRSNLDDKIAFGEQAPMYQYPWMAMLIYRSASSGIEGPECGGTVINSRYVLTAAHCIEGQIQRLSYVRLGEYDTRTDPDCDEYQDCAPPFRRYTVAEYRTHPNFTRTVRSGNDIGLLRLNPVIVFSEDEVSPICLPFSASLNRFDPTLFWITGWGLTERLEASPILLHTRLPSVDCSLSTHSICAGFGNGTLHCRGDSGGPMKVQVPEFNFRYVQYGIISAGPSCGVPGTPGVSTRVAFFMKWILDNLTE
ncbi:serine protease 7-like [Uranotaenia lowii]|uniref:serine protease 7-like n=1 Tax=Uranotaenia lowii TaxID=190385 RepID=UPI002478F9FD|nr:serine protease 7-like [Uranotaenia lowii]